jgi:hypothetical protein
VILAPCVGTEGEPRHWHFRNGFRAEEWLVSWGLGLPGPKKAFPERLPCPLNGCFPGVVAESLQGRPPGGFGVTSRLPGAPVRGDDCESRAARSIRRLKDVAVVMRLHEFPFGRFAPVCRELSDRP